MEDKFAEAKAKLREAHYASVLYLKAYRAAYATFAPDDNGFVHVSGIGRADFPEHVKTTLRELNATAQKLNDLAYDFFPRNTHKATKWKIDKVVYDEVKVANGIS